MAIHHAEIPQATRGPGFYDLTAAVEAALAASKLRTGILTVFCRHTSCSLTFMENCSPQARRDLQKYLDTLVPPGNFEHDLEGEDDMPAHIKTVLTKTSESIPFDHGKLLLGTWQGLYLWEHRKAPHRRSVLVTIVGE
jgi:secondary thiamine-phosphate synthase enzyme